MPTERNTYIVDGPGLHSEHRSKRAAIQAARANRPNETPWTGTVVTAYTLSGTHRSVQRIWPTAGELHTY